MAPAISCFDKLSIGTGAVALPLAIRTNRKRSQLERLFAEGKTAACLFTDVRNPMSNRCYANIGFAPYCDAWLYLRATT